MKKKDGLGRFAPKAAHGDQLKRVVEHKIPKNAKPKKGKGA